MPIEIGEGFHAQGVSGLSHGVCNIKVDLINVDRPSFIGWEISEWRVR
jgi:hypothetical protein